MVVSVAIMKLRSSLGLRTTLTPSSSNQAFAMAVKNISAVEKLDGAYVEDTATDSQQEVVVREFDPKFMRKTMLKVR
jgi:hypothetical protein